MLFGLTPFSAVFYPVSVLPRAVQPIALALPSSHVFEGMRAALGGVVRWDQLALGGGLNVIWTVRRHCCCSPGNSAAPASAARC